ncbi:MAG: hypothetical protein IKD08_05850 [Alphaproteobacteria bacterium]|nr:hypothetical protein [Alphaproteobacteria bacterium]
MLPLFSLNWNYLAFIWLGAYVSVNLLTAGYIIYRRKHNLPILNCSGAIILSAYVVFSALAFSVFASSEALKTMTWGEFVFVVGAAWGLMLVNYLMPDTRKGNAAKVLCLLAAIAGSFFFMSGSAFSPLPVPQIVGGLLALLCWLWLTKAFVVMNKVPGLTISTVGLIGFGVFFVAIFNSYVPQDVGLLAATLALTALGFRAWNKYPAKILLNKAAVLPLAFLCGWFLVQLAAAGFWASALILPLFYFAETGYAFIKKYFPQLKSTPFAVQVSESDLPQENLLSFIFRKNLPLFLLAPLATTPSYNLFFVGLAFLFAVYGMYQLKHFGEKEPSLREITSGIYQSAKQGFAQQKQLYQEIITKRAENDNPKPEEEKPVKVKATVKTKAKAKVKAKTKTASKTKTKSKAKTKTAKKAPLASRA